jgi:hypothetical protein
LDANCIALIEFKYFLLNDFARIYLDANCIALIGLNYFLLNEFVLIFQRKIRKIIHSNVLGLGEEADFEALNCLPALNLIRSTKLHLSTEPAFLPNACYR